MRNTFVKLFLALAMCFMIGSALVACGSSFELTTSPDGYIMVNGEKTDVKVVTEVASNACEEHDLVVSVVKEHTLVEEGVYLETCTLCNDYAKVINDTKHDWEEGVKQVATCYEDAFEGQVCKICGARGEGKTETGSAKHAWSKDRAIDNVDADAPACTEGGLVVRTCDACGLIDEPRIVAAVGCTVEYWKDIKYPKLDEKGEASGRCIYCEEVVSYDLPAIYVKGEFNAEAYSLEYVGGVAPTCTKASQAIYTYVAAEAQNTEKVWNSNLKFNVKADAPATDHYLAGKKADSWKLADGSYPYFADVNGNDKVEAKETLGVNLFAGDTVMCGIEGENTRPGYFTCTACEEVVKVAAVTVEHNGPRTVKEVAKCYENGVDIVSCYLCKKDKEVVTTAEHNVVYDLVAFDAKGNEIKTLNEDTVIAYWELTPYCDVKVPVKTDDDDTKETAVTYTNCWKGETVKVAANHVKEQETIDSTCFAEGYTLYQYTKVDPADESKTEYIPVKVPLPLAAHTLNGKTTDKYDVITVDIEGINPFAAEEFKTCGEWYNAYFECSVCAKEVKAGNADVTTAIAKTLALKAHVFKVVPTDDEELAYDATCTEDGLQVVICSYDKCGEDGSNWKNYAKEDPRVIPAFGHTYTYSDSISGTTLELTAVCSVCEGEGEDAQVNHEVKFENVDLKKFIKDEKSELVTKLSCVSKEVRKYTITLAIVENEDGELEIAKATLKDPKSKEKVYNEKYIFTVTFNVEGDKDPQGHEWTEEKDYIKVTALRDWDKDGVNDQLIEYTYKHCHVCDMNELMGYEVIESYTDITIADAVKDEE